MSDEMNEIWELYADDGAQSLDAMEDALLKLRDSAPADQSSLIGALFRAIHTFKGNSRVLGLSTVENRAHLSEDLIGLVRDKGVPLDEEILDVLVLSCDTLRDMLDETADTRADVAPEPSQDLADKLREAIAARSEEPAPAADAPEPEVQTPEPEPEPEAPVAAEVEVKPEAPPAAPEAGAPTADDAAPAPRLIDDQKTRDIFRQMFAKSLAKFQAVIDEPGEDAAERAAKEAKALSFATARVGLPDWSALLDEFRASVLAGVSDVPAATRDLVAALDGMADAEFSGGDAPSAESSAPGEEAPVAFLRQAQPFYEKLTEIGAAFEAGSAAPENDLKAVSDAAVSAAQSFGFVKVEHAAKSLATPTNASDFILAESRFMLEMLSVERAASQIPDDVVPPSGALSKWSASRVYDIVTALRTTVEEMGQDVGRTERYDSFDIYMRMSHNACRRMQMESAAELAMAFVDIFSRLKTSNGAPDRMLINIVSGFINTLEMVFGSIQKGDAPDMEEINQLFEDASNAFMANHGVASARMIEKRLDLPKVFHSVLPPESVRKAQTAIEERLNFFIIRADLNNDQAKAEAFLDWIGTGDIRMITSVTIFKEDDTEFDFLIASRLDGAAIVEALATIDPSAEHLSLKQSLDVDGGQFSEDAGDGPASSSGEPSTLDSNAAKTARLVDMVGEVSAGQSMLQYMLEKLSKQNFLHLFETRMKQNGWAENAPEIRREIRSFFDEISEQILSTYEMQAQLSDQLVQIHEFGMSIRSKPVGALLQSLAAFAETRAKAHGHQVSVTTEGSDIAVDQSLLDTMRVHVRAILQMRIALDTPPSRFHLSVVRVEKGIQISIEDDGDPGTGGETLEEIKRALEDDVVDFRISKPPTGGMRFHIVLPNSMVALDGMVVRIRDIKYVVPLDSVQQIRRCQEHETRALGIDEDSRMLRLSDGSHIPICELERETPRDTRSPTSNLFVIVTSADRRLAIPVDEMIGQQMVLLRPLKGVLSGVRGLTNVALLAGGDVGLVLSVGELEAA